MIIRTLTLVGGLAGATVSSQFPEFSQQYTQRLGGAVDALAEVVSDFDASADAVGLTRVAALQQMQGTDFLERRRADMTGTFARYDGLRADLVALEGQGPFMRAYHLPRFSDPQITQAAWTAFQPAVPLNFAGLIFSAVGFLLASVILGVVFKLIAWPFRRRRATPTKPA